MFDTILGLPVHPLVVHGAVVLLPLTAIASVVAVTRRRSRGWLTFLAIAALVCVGIAIVAEQSGEVLASRVGDPGQHEEFGEMVKSGAFALFLALVLAWASEKSRKMKALIPLTKALVVLAAAGAIAITALAGHSGAEATWKTIIENTTPGSSD